MIKLLFALLFTTQLQAFSTFGQAVGYSQSHKECIPIENQNVLNPRFDRYHASAAPTSFSRFLHWLGLYSQPWSPSNLERAATKVTATLKRQEVISLSLPEGTNFLIIGPLFGAYHSLVRILSDLKKRGILDENLNMCLPNHYLVFQGNIVDGSPYILETLTLVLSLLAQNPKHVIYLRGQYENQGYWLNHGLKRELAQRTSLNKFKPLLLKVFALLPSRLDLRLGTDDSCISITSLPLKNKPNNLLKALLEPEHRTVSYAEHPGIALLQPTYNITHWSLFSAPTELYKKYYDFYYDAYVHLTLGTPIINSTLALHNHDVRNQQASFSRSALYNIVTAQKISSETIHINQDHCIALGSTMDLSRTNKSLGINLKAGLAAATNRINSHGGLHKRLFRIYVEDDQYLAPRARVNIKQFMKNTCPIIVAPAGSQTLEASLDLLKNNKIYVLFPNTGSLLFRDPSLTSIINLRASYNSEAEALIYYCHKKLLGKDFAFFHQDDTYGYAALNGARSMMKKLTIEKWTETCYQTNTIYVKEAAEAIKKANPDIIGLFSSAAATIELLKQLGVEFLSTKKLFAISPLGSNSFKHFLDSMGLKITFAQVVPNPKSSDIEIVKEYRQEIAKLGKLPDTYSLEGYIAASLTADILEKIDGPITIESLKKVIENIKDYTFKGLKLTYNPHNRQLANELWIETPNEEWIKQDIAELEKLTDARSTTECKS